MNSTILSYIRLKMDKLHNFQLYVCKIIKYFNNNSVLSFYFFLTIGIIIYLCCINGFPSSSNYNKNLFLQKSILNISLLVFQGTEF